MLDARAGIVGQYWQRMREIFLSAYLRTLAYAVSEWGLPIGIAERYCAELVEAIAGLFDVEPSGRPEWLSDLPERFCASDADFALLIRELVESARADGMRLVSLDAPVDSSVRKYAKLMLSAHLVTPDYQFPDAADLYERMSLLMVTDTFELKGPPAEMTIEEASTNGESGNEVAVCSCLFPMPFGSWQGDYMIAGLRIPATYITGDAEICCTSAGIDLVKPENVHISQTRMWNDHWVPPHPKGGSTRCGVATMIDETVLAAAQERHGRELAWFARLQVWDRESEYGDYLESERTSFTAD